MEPPGGCSSPSIGTVLWGQDGALATCGSCCTHRSQHQQGNWVLSTTPGRALPPALPQGTSPLFPHPWLNVTADGVGAPRGAQLRASPSSVATHWKPPGTRSPISKSPHRRLSHAEDAGTTEGLQKPSTAPFTSSLDKSSGSVSVPHACCNPAGALLEGTQRPGRGRGAQPRGGTSFLGVR